MVHTFLTAASAEGLEMPQEAQQDDLLALLLDVLKKVPLTTPTPRRAPTQVPHQEPEGVKSCDVCAAVGQ